jgi:hypothetical protein
VTRAAWPSRENAFIGSFKKSAATAVGLEVHDAHFLHWAVIPKPKGPAVEFPALYPAPHTILVVGFSGRGSFVSKSLKETEDTISLLGWQMHERIQNFIFDDEAITHESEACGLQGLMCSHEMFSGKLPPTVHAFHAPINAGSLSFTTAAIFLREEVGKFDALCQTELGDFLFECGE